MTAIPIEAQGVEKGYGEVRALRGVSLAIAPGSAVGLVGPNGAGKSSLLRILCGLSRPDAGAASIHGHDPIRDPARVNALLGCVPEQLPLFDLLTGHEQLLWVGQLHDVPAAALDRRIGELTAAVDLTKALHRRISGYSKGMRQKLAFVAALIHDPRVILMDEPFDGVDVLAVQAMKDVLSQFVEAGAAIVLSSHVLQLVEDVCQRFIVINDGLIAFDGDRQALSREADRLSAGAAGSGRSLESVFLGLVAPGRLSSRLRTVAAHHIGGLE